jgi:hypothetical protein
VGAGHRIRFNRFGRRAPRIKVLSQVDGERTNVERGFTVPITARETHSMVGKSITLMEIEKIMTSQIFDHYNGKITYPDRRDL